MSYKKSIVSVLLILFSLLLVGCTSSSGTVINKIDTSTIEPTEFLFKKNEKNSDIVKEDLNDVTILETVEVPNRYHFPELTKVSFDIGTVKFDDIEFTLDRFITVSDFENQTGLIYSTISNSIGSPLYPEYRAAGYNYGNSLVYIEAIKDNIIVEDWEEQDKNKYMVNSIKAVEKPNLDFTVSILDFTAGTEQKTVESILGIGTELAEINNTFYYGYENDTNILVIIYEENKITGFYVYVK